MFLIENIIKENVIGKFIIDCKLNDLKSAIINSNKNKTYKHIVDLLKGNNTPIILEFEGMDIELTILDIVNGKLDICFVLCVNSVENGWETLDCSKIVFDINMLDNEEKLINLMFKEIKKIAKKNNLEWKTINKFE